MYIQRQKCNLVFVYKCINNLGPCYLNVLFTKKDTPYMIRNNSLVIQPKLNTVSHGINSIVYHGSKMWNCLPMNIKTAKNVKQFKYLIKKYDQPLCKCNHCLLNIN